MTKLQKLIAIIVYVLGGRKLSIATSFYFHINNMSNTGKSATKRATCDNCKRKREVKHLENYSRPYRYRNWQYEYNVKYIRWRCIDTKDCEFIKQQKQK